MHAESLEGERFVLDLVDSFFCGELVVGDEHLQEDASQVPDEHRRVILVAKDAFVEAFGGLVCGAPQVFGLGPVGLLVLAAVDEGLHTPLVVLGEDDVFGPEVSGDVIFDPDGVDSLEDLIEYLQCLFFIYFALLHVLLEGKFVGFNQKGYTGFGGDFLLHAQQVLREHHLAQVSHHAPVEV